MSEKKFPILGTGESIDWNLIAPHEKQAMENHCGQTLEQLARRHGLSWYELLCVLLDKPFTEVKYDKEKNYKKLCQRALVLEEVQQYRAIGTPEECRKSLEICKAMVERNITPDDTENYMKFEDECIKQGFTLVGLLKAGEKHEAMEPIRMDKCTCPSCGTHNEIWKKRRNTLPRDIVYCWHCGQAVEIKREL